VGETWASVSVGVLGAPTVHSCCSEGCLDKLEKWVDGSVVDEEGYVWFPVESQVEVVGGLPIVPAHELAAAFDFEDTSAHWFRDEAHPQGNIGRLKLCCAAASKRAEFKDRCPTLAAIIEAARGLGSYCFMLSWGAGIYCHVDLRALKNGASDRVGGHKSGRVLFKS